ncbi:ParA family protein [Bailinhaonella thermotolerans]|uniref:ParA family protein n=1 Tax=Bailinhaonella thermotolerans TaxID=1070861 RepID=A0A3A4A1N3_9ACTN|nr:ParA family protein [Bailinhaonella thermotolerans]RJL21054.1 ParA family protein [Bailinhaonella thermotolerans]
MSITAARPARSERRLRLPRPLVITVGILKGGAGKSTSTFFLAVFFAKVYGLRVLVVDADPLSQTCYSWYRNLKRRGVELPFTLVTFPSPHVDDCIDDHVEQGAYDVIIVDTGGESPDIFKAALRKSHELVIAVAPTPGELERVPPTFKAAEEAAQDVAHEIGVRVLLTKVPSPPSNEGRDARAWLGRHDFEAFQAQATNWKWYRQAIHSENPLHDLAEYEDVGDELVAPYDEDAA